MLEDHLPPNLPEQIRAITGKIDAIHYPAQGATSQVMFLQTLHATFAAKRATQPRYRSWLRREYSILQSLAETTLPVPRAHLFVPSAYDDRESWLLMSCLPGESLRAVLRTTSDPLARPTLIVTFGQLSQAVHDCRIPAALDQEQSPWLDRMLDQAAIALQHDVVDGTPELLQHVRQHRPPAGRDTLIHGDCTLDNVLVHNGIVNGLIDWAGGGRGDPRYDLALATQVEREAFGTASDYDAFYSGYRGARLTEAEHSYFLDLDEFF